MARILLANQIERRGGIIVGWWDSSSSARGLGSRPCRVTALCLVQRQHVNTLYSHSTSLHSGVYIGAGEFNGGGTYSLDSMFALPSFSQALPVLWKSIYLPLSLETVGEQVPTASADSDSRHYCRYWSRSPW